MEEVERIIIKSYRCDTDKCKGRLLPTGASRMLTKDGKTEYYHKCSICGHEMTFDVEYPIISEGGDTPDAD